jgi:hypothetical protein
MEIMTKFTRKQFIAILESGQYKKITGRLGGRENGSGQKNCCTLGAILDATGNLGKNGQAKNRAYEYSYLPRQLAEDLDITPEFETRIFTLNDQTGDDNFAAVIAFLKKEWNITDTTEINMYDTFQKFDAYFEDYYKTEAATEDYGYNVS